ncbi:RraA family protein [Paenarthrobacter sp. PAE-2]|jgi:RraA family protein|uniref:RraA family protein n=1 Tax=Paenarthrobacter sp. PAE-2 TaxID=2982532 RepID=UPI0022325E38|nr:RraA family protein [Paenarthrobacter sp. PAE-2]MCW3767056.1 RraA family protein [Paenarthrobacter sp. PAE-2]
MYINVSADNISVNPEWPRPPQNLVQSLAAYPPALIGDVRNRLDMMSADIRCLTPNARLAGAILPIQVWEGDNLAIHRGLDEAKPGDVLVIAGNGVTNRSVFGGILAEICLSKGVTGVIIDGAVRDIEEINDMGLALYAKATVPAGPSKNGPGAVGKPVACGNVVCNPGDIVIGDHDGIVVVPQSEAFGTLHRLPHQEDMERQIRDRVKATVTD